MARNNRSVINTKPRPFISTWNTSLTSAGSSNSNQIKLPLTASGLYNFTVNWGDNTSSSISASNQAEVTHTYGTAGTYTLSITGFLKGWSFQSVTAPTDRLKILSISQWGCVQFPNVQLTGATGSFSGCFNLNLTGSITDTPNFKGITTTRAMFNSCSALNNVTNIEKWDTSKLTDLCSMFALSPNFDANIGAWNISNATDISFMFSSNFRDGKFNNSGSDSIKNWDTSKVTTMTQLFLGQPLFNQPIGSWNTGNVATMSFVFYSYPLPRSGGLFNQPLNSWNTSKVTNMNSMFLGQRVFNQNIGSWDVSNVTTMNQMFLNQNFNGLFNNGNDSSIKNWNTSKVTNFGYMFQGQPYFNQEVGLWNVSSGSTILQMFAGYAPPRSASRFNNAGSDSIKNWNTSNATSMLYLFGMQESFNQPIGSWDTSKVTNMQQMFVIQSGRTGAFNQNIGSWNVSLVASASNFMANRTPNDFSTSNYDALLIGWASRSVKPNVAIGFGTTKYTPAASASRASLIAAPNNWTIADGGST